MVVSCSAFGCTNRSKRDSDISFHLFPLKDAALVKKWLHAVKRKNFTPTKNSALCSVHFTNEDFLVRPGAYKRKLCPNAVPSIFVAFSEYYQPKKKIKRKVRKESSLVEECVAGPSGLALSDTPSNTDEVAAIQEVEIQCDIVSRSTPEKIKYNQIKIRPDLCKADVCI